KPSLPQFRDAADECKGCDLYKRATQTVFGEGSRSATFMLVGEQPGDREDVEGHPFIGPAGKLLQRAPAEAGIDKKQTFQTNVVKPFNWAPSPRGKKRMRSKPSAAQIKACKPWLEQEIRLVRPRVLIVLGATAAQAFLGASFRVTKSRGKPVAGTDLAPVVIA